jgi:hydroxymethylpyrimidine pyrophosphatase-like HAD family hydrolase
VIDRLLQAFPGKLEQGSSLLMGHEVNQTLYGYVDPAQAAALLAREVLPLQLQDNGAIHPHNHNLGALPQIHIYHLMPSGVSKAHAVAANITQRGLLREQTVAIGDAAGDVAMAQHTGSLVVVGNALKVPAVAAALDSYAEKPVPLYSTKGHTADGWVEFAQALLAAKG